jgi:hypothetical protein
MKRQKSAVLIKKGIAMKNIQIPIMPGNDKKEEVKNAKIYQEMKRLFSLLVKERKDIGMF